MDRPNKIREILIQIAEEQDPLFLFPALSREAQLFATSNAYAFTIACCLDRGLKSETIWTIPWDMKNDLGHLDPHLIFNQGIEPLTALFKRLPHKPRFLNAAPRTVYELTQMIVNRFDGNPAGLWLDRPPLRIKDDLLGIFGVGPALASMALLLIDRAFPGQMSEHGRSWMDIKPDVHTMRVLFRLGVASGQDEVSATLAARLLSPVFPGAVDPGLWYVGRQWCRPSLPNCSQCPLISECDHGLNQQPI